MKKVLHAVFFLVWINGMGQNLVPNGDFESTTSCPSNLGELSYAFPWCNPTSTSPDYFNLCAGGGPCGAPSNLTGYQYPHSGNGYAGIVVLYGGNYREYIQVPLTTTLSPGSSYSFRMSIVSSNIYSKWTGHIGAYFSDTMVFLQTGQPLPFRPQIVNADNNIPDSVNWMTVSGTYTATGDERYMIIGNFDDDAHTPYITANANATWPGTYIYIDDVSLTRQTTTGIAEVGGTNFNAYPNPANVNSQITFTYPASDADREMVINDVNGKEMVRYELPQYSGRQQVSLPELSPGIYVAKLLTGDKTCSTMKLVIE